MAGDWIKIEVELPDKPEVHALANILSLDPDTVVGKLIRVWQWFDKHTTDGNAHGVTHLLIGRLTAVNGFGEAMMLVGWLEQKNKTLVMPKFDRHTSQSAKTRALTNKRVKRLRNAPTVTESLPEKKRKEKNLKTNPLPEASGEFASFWQTYPKKVGKIAAINAWKKTQPPLRDVLKALSWQRTTDQWRKNGGQFIPYPASYLMQGRWTDDPPAFETGSDGKPWFASASGIKAKGTERGIIQERDEPFPVYCSRVYAAENITREMVDKAEREFAQ